MQFVTLQRCETPSWQQKTPRSAQVPRRWSVYPEFPRGAWER